MSIVLTSDDLRQLARAAQVLVTPSEHPSADHWRVAVNRTTKELLGADSAGFLLPVEGSLALLSEEHDLSQLAAYPTLIPPPVADGTPIFRRAVELGVTRLSDAYGHSYRLYLRSEYYNEYAKPNRACDTLGAMISLGGADPRSVASLQYWHDTPVARLFSEREVQLLRLLYPAFRAGVEAQMLWRKHTAELLRVVDGLGAAAIIFNLEGRIVHETPALQRMLAIDPGAHVLRAAAVAVAAALRSMLGALSWSHDREARPLAPSKEVATGAAHYSLRGWLQDTHQGETGRVIFVAIERLTAIARSDAELRSEFSLTPAEIRVARLLAKGSSNTEIATQLGVSPHTARRHTEQVFRKLAVRARAEVATRLQR